MKSGSDISQKQFLLLRVSWIKQKKFNAATYNLVQENIKQQPCISEFPEKRTAERTINTVRA